MMIAASEPVEFIPRGRQAVTEHPGPLVSKQQINVPIEHLLLYRLQNVNISNEESALTEYWSIREICKDNDEIINDLEPLANRKVSSAATEITSDFFINSEHELYVKGTTAVWTKGINEDVKNCSLPRRCFTCDTPIQHAFFCSLNFIKSEDPDKRNPKKINNSDTTDNQNNSFWGGKEDFGICLIDATSLRVYTASGEDYLGSLEFLITNVWQTSICILLERSASTVTIDNETIQMPRMFSLTHPLNDMCPMLMKTSSGIISFLTDDDHKIVFADPETDLVIFYDNKIGRHFISKLRKATAEEQQIVGAANETETTGNTMNFSACSGMQSFANSNSFKLDESKQKNHTANPRSSLPGNLTQASTKRLNVTPTSFLLQNPMVSSPNRSMIQSPYDRLQSSFAGGGQSAYIEEMRKIGQARPSKPLLPDMCLEHIWTENTANRDYPEMASQGFIHIDLIGQTFLCYLLPRTGTLMLSRIERSNFSDSPIFSTLTSIPAKDAINLNRLKMMAILAPCGTLVLYTGHTLVAKVHIGGVLSKIQPPAPINPTFASSFPRRSSLLPSVQTEASFEDELHLLSPVHPLQSQLPLRSSSCCINLRDAASNRLTLSYPNGKMYRISIPVLSENPLVTKCINTLRQVLKKDSAVMLLSKWYGVRNAPGSQDLSSEKEWLLFRNCLLEFLGRPLEINDGAPTQSNSSSSISSSDEPKKRRKTDNCQGSDDDWLFILKHLSKVQKNAATSPDESSPPSSTNKNDPNAILFPYIPVVFYALHLLYEEIKVDVSLKSQQIYVAKFLYQIAIDLNLEAYCLHYFLDYPELVYINSSSYIDDSCKKKLLYQQYLSEEVPNIFKSIYEMLNSRHEQLMPYPYIANVNQMSKNMIELVALITTDSMKNSIATINFLQLQPKQPEQQNSFSGTKPERDVKIMNAFLERKISRQDIARLPTALHYLLADVLENQRNTPPIDCPPEAYELFLRPELYANHINEFKNNLISQKNYKMENSLSPRAQPNTENITTETLSDDGMTHISTKLFRLRFPRDLRIDEVRRMLASANPAIINLTQRVGVSDHDFIEEKEKHLFAICTRTMALPIGRGMFTLRTCTPAATESLKFPKLCLSGKELEKGGTIELQQIEVPPNMNVWPMFHNGVAAGLQLTPDCKDVDSTWIVYNKSKGQQEGSTEHAGFLMALGLNGHLKSLSFMSIYEYLVKCDEMTSVGLILGISCAHRGTMDTTTTKLLSVHIEALLPATALELDIPQNIQIAAIMGIGFIYQGTAKRHIAEVLLQEIGRPPGPEMENCVERESYSLTAGLALGLVTLGKGESPPGLKDLQLTDTLHYYMVGGKKRPLTGSQKEKYKIQSFQVREGNMVNIDVTAPAATLALGLMFFRTGNEAVAHWMAPPDTSYLLDLVRPDLLLLRIFARGLILWDDIKPTEEWLQSQYPESLKFDLKSGPKDLDNPLIDHEALCQAYCNIVTGAALCIAFRYAGTEDEEAMKTLRKTFDLFLNMNGLYVGEYAGKVTVESCLMLILLSMSLVSAGSGDLNILRICRMLRTRLGTANSHVTYGSHMCAHMALGFQFMGAGRFTISQSPEAIAALVCALFPKFPTHSNDNRYHLQAFRHLYVLAVEPRLLLPRDIDSGKLCLCNVVYVTLNAKHITKMAPCMLPDLETLQSVTFEDSNYWTITFAKGKNWNQLKNVLKKAGCIDIKQKAGCLSHMDDPTRLRSFLAQTLTTEQYCCWKTHSLNLMTFSNNATVQNFISKFLSNERSVDKQIKSEEEVIQTLTLHFYHCLTKDTVHALRIYVDLLMILCKTNENLTNYDIWQFKIIQTIVERKRDCVLLSTEHLKSLASILQTRMEKQIIEQKALIQRYLFSSNVSFLQEISPVATLQKAAALITFYDLPRNVLNCVELSGSEQQLNYLKILIELRKLNLDVKTIQIIAQIVQQNI